ncbi:MAG: fumarylacetoacetate hydrolase family protein, partial [Bacteroidota bacterium]
MKLVTFLHDGTPALGLFIENNIYHLSEAAKKAGLAAPPDTMREFLDHWDESFDKAKEVESAIKSQRAEIGPTSATYHQLLAPVNEPTSCRDGYAFRQHVEAARRNRKVPMIAEFDQYPIFYFTNHNAIQVPGAIRCMPDHFQKLDFELEVAVVIGKKGRNIRASEADRYIAGYMIMNDMSARTLQMEEMLLNLGPAKGKDFSTVIGPWLVTPEELETRKVPAKPGHTGNNYDLS